MQLLHAISKSRKNDLSDVQENIDNLVIQDHHIIRKHHVFLRLRSKQFTILLLLKKKNNLHQDYTIKRSSAISILTGKKSTYWFTLSQKTTTYVLFSLNY